MLRYLGVMEKTGSKVSILKFLLTQCNEGKNHNLTLTQYHFYVSNTFSIYFFQWNFCPKNWKSQGMIMSLTVKWQYAKEKLLSSLLRWQCNFVINLSAREFMTNFVMELAYPLVQHSTLLKIRWHKNTDVPIENKVRDYCLH